MQNFEARCHQRQPQLPKKAILFIKLPSFNGESDPNLYLG